MGCPVHVAFKNNGEHKHTVSGMAEWLRRSLAEWKVPGSNLTMGKVSEKFRKKKKKKKKKKKASYPLLA